MCLCGCAFSLVNSLVLLSLFAFWSCTIRSLLPLAYTYIHTHGFQSAIHIEYVFLKSDFIPFYYLCGLGKK